MSLCSNVGHPLMNFRWFPSTSGFVFALIIMAFVNIYNLHVQQQERAAAQHRETEQRRPRN